jgi:hypothetical protein
MSKLRVSVAALMASIAFCGVGFAALRSSSLLWADTVFTVAVALLTVAVLKVIAARGRRRAFWAGYATCGWLYLSLSLLPPFDDSVGPHLLTTTLVDLSYPWVVPVTPLPGGMGGGGMAGMGGGGMMGRGMGSNLMGGMGGGMAGMGGGMGGGGMMGIGGGASREPTYWESLRNYRGGLTTPSPNYGTWNVFPLKRYSTDTYLRIGHSLVALLSGLVGGWLALRFLAARSVATGMQDGPE